MCSNKLDYKIAITAIKQNILNCTNQDGYQYLWMPITGNKKYIMAKNILEKGDDAIGISQNLWRRKLVAGYRTALFQKSYVV